VSSYLDSLKGLEGQLSVDSRGSTSCALDGPPVFGEGLPSSVVHPGV
jgi:hypothetical protein